MPDAAGNIKGIAITGRAGETVERIFAKQQPEQIGHGSIVARWAKLGRGHDCGQRPETCKWGDACADCR